MMQSTCTRPGRLHAAIIMDGNGRWALARGLPRLAGHRAGAEALRRTVEAAPGLGIGILTLFAFSSDNWRRPPDEVAGLMQLLAEHLRSETGRAVENGGLARAARLRLSAVDDRRRRVVAVPVRGGRGWRCGGGGRLAATPDRSRAADGGCWSAGFFWLFSLPCSGATDCTARTPCGLFHHCFCYG